MRRHLLTETLQSFLFWRETGWVVMVVVMVMVAMVVQKTPISTFLDLAGIEVRPDAEEMGQVTALILIWTVRGRGGSHSVVGVT